MSLTSSGVILNLLIVGRVWGVGGGDLCHSVLGVSIVFDVDLSVPFVSADSIFAQASVYFVACAVVVCRHLAAVS